MRIAKTKRQAVFKPPVIPREVSDDQENQWPRNSNVKYTPSPEGDDGHQLNEVLTLERAGEKAIADSADAADADASKAGSSKGQTDPRSLDVLVNNAGVAFPKKFEQATLEELDRLIDINVRGTFVATQAALKHMKSGGRIIMIACAWASVS